MFADILSPEDTGICRNLCPPLSGTGLQPVRMPSLVVAGDWRPVCFLTGADGAKTLLVASGNTVGTVSRGQVADRIELDETPLAFHPFSRCVYIVTQSRRLRVSLDDSGSLEAVDEGLPMPCVRLRAVAAPTVAVTAPAVSLSSAYQSGAEVTDKDRSRLHSHVAAVYNRLYCESAMLGRYIQPVVACLRFLTADGRVAFCSQPTLLAHPGSAGLDSVFEFGSDDGVTLRSVTVERPSYRIAVDLPAAPSLAHIASAQLIVAPQPANVDPRNPDVGVVLRPRSSAGVLVAVSMHCGVARSIGGEGGAAAVSALAAWLDEGNGHVIATIRSPFAAEATVTVSEPASPYISAAADSDELEKILTNLPEPCELPCLLLSAPHLCLPGKFTASGGAVVMGALRSRRFDGYDIASFAAEVADSPWEGYVQVTFADGSTLVRRSSGTTGAPVTFAPMLSYPAPDVSSITVGLQVEGRTPQLGVFTPVCDCRRGRSVYVAADCRPFILPEAPGYAAPDECHALCTFDDCVAAASAIDPMAVKAVSCPAWSCLHTMVPARFGQSSWDFGRARFYAFTASGTYSVSVDTKRSALAVSLLDGRAADTDKCAVSTPLGVMAAVGDDLVSINGSKVVTVESRRGAAALLWDGSRRELWLIPEAAAEFTVMCPERAWGRYTVMLALDASRSIQGAPASSTAVYTSTGSSVAAVTEICLQRTVPTPGRSSGVATLEVGMCGYVSNFQVSLRRDWLGKFEPGNTTQVTLEGEISAPIPFTIMYMPAAATSRITFQGYVSRGWSISYVSLYGEGR